MIVTEFDQIPRKHVEGEANCEKETKKERKKQRKKLEEENKLHDPCNLIILHIYIVLHVL